MVADGYRVLAHGADDVEETELQRRAVEHLQGKAGTGVMYRLYGTQQPAHAPRLACLQIMGMSVLQYMKKTRIKRTSASRGARRWIRRGSEESEGKGNGGAVAAVRAPPGFESSASWVFSNSTSSWSDRSAPLLGPRFFGAR